MKNGIFIALEGPDGSGKSTVAKLLKEKIEKTKGNCVLTREPGGTPISEKIREILLSNENSEMSNNAEALLYAASRAQHVDEKIRPLIMNGENVITDRYFLSSLAYQGYGRGLGIEKIMEINQFAIGNMYPDIILFFDISPETALSRIFANREGDRIENEGNNFHNITYNGYQEAIKKYNKNVVVIDANGTVEETLDNCLKELKKLF